MRNTLLLLTALTGVAFLIGRRAGDAGGTGKHYSTYQRAALVWTSPLAVRVRRRVRKRARVVRGRSHR